MFYPWTWHWHWLAVLIGWFAYVYSNDPECSNFLLAGCSCSFLDNMLGITCSNAADILELPKSLDSFFGTHTSFEIVLEHFSTVPSSVIEGLNVSRFIVDDPETVAVSENAFDGVNELLWFHVYLSSLTRIPNFRNITHSLSRVNVDNSLLTKIQDEFQNLPLLKRLSLRNNTLDYIQADAFNGTTAIRFLDLSYNRFVSLPESLLNKLTELLKLDLSHNSLHTVHGLFQNLGEKLKFLSLDFNNLSDANDILATKMPVLTSLSLNNNPLRQLPVKMFNSTIPQIITLSLRHCNLTDFRAENFLGLFRLKLLDLSFNQIKHIGSDYMTFGDGFDLIMNANGIESFDGGITHRMRTLSVEENNLQSLGNMIAKTRLSGVDVSRNRLTVLEKKEFADLHKLQFISFRQNQIERMDSRCFESAENSLSYLDLSSNRLSFLNSSLQFLPVLKTLNISNNLLENLDYEELKGVNGLSSLYLQKNKILVLSGKVQNLPSLQYLILKNNEISQLNMDQMPRTLQYLFIKGNPLKCNCQLYSQFLKKLKKDFPEVDIMPCTQTSVSEDLSHHPCPSSCSCYCDGNVNPPSISVNCSFRYLTSIPSELKTDASSSSVEGELYGIDDKNFVIYDRIVSLDLSHNNIESLKEVYFFRTLEKLYLSNNRLRTLPYNIMNLPKLKETSLSGNDWSCDCDDGKAVEFRNWLLPDDRHVLDVNRSVCYNLGKNKIIVSVSEAEICPGNFGSIVAIVLAVLGLFVMILAATIVYTRYKYKIEVWLCSKGIIRRKEQIVGCDKTLDAFISFSNADRNFVAGEIVPAISELCPSVNFFSEGIHLYEDLMKERKLYSPSSLDNKITVIIVTRNFLEDPSCLSVMRIHKEEHDDFHPVIVIKVGDLSPDWEDKIKTFVPHATYLQWGDINFRHNFTNAVPQTLGPTAENNPGNFPPLITSEL